MMPKLPPQTSVTFRRHLPRWGEPGHTYYAAAVQVLTDELIDDLTVPTVIAVTTVKVPLYDFLRGHHA